MVISSVKITSPFYTAVAKKFFCFAWFEICDILDQNGKLLVNITDLI